MQWTATERIAGLTPAPGGLAFVQDVLNSVSDGWTGPKHLYDDLLHDLPSAQAWVIAAAKALEVPLGINVTRPSLSEEDLPALRELRDELRQLVSGVPDDTDTGALKRLASAPVMVQTLPGPRYVSKPSGDGWHWIASAILAECYLAQQEGTWARLKICPNPVCVATFYDRTRNNSQVWHSIRSCGNPNNLRASRARKKASEA
ncbi:CGNR zinc finger domain-containing protein [Streptomyces sp. NPDC092369]|uniref:CGNR zinc finger domain-containing protein n=1 Tax=Streptomyces sp. NPDC092369 TaxID=3366015 RepID=UPI0037F56218